MKRKQDLFLVPLAIIVAIGSGIFLTAFQKKTIMPNIILIYVDDLGYGDLSTYGGSISSPNIQRIADAGIKFTDFYVSAPVCSPSRYSLLTGSYPQRSLHNILSAGMPGDSDRIDVKEKLLPAYLKNTGYTTALIGKWHLGASAEKDLPTYHGFDRFIGLVDGCIDYFRHTYGTLKKSWLNNATQFEEEGYATDLLTNHALTFVNENVEKKQPYFLYLAYNAPHFGKSDPADLPDTTVVLNKATYKNFPIANTLQAPRNYLNRFENIKDPHRRIYTAMVANLDDNVGRLLDALQKNGTLNNTLLWFISDNGGYAQSYFGHASNGALRGEKAQLFEGGIRVPALVCWPNKIKSRQVVKQVVGNVDLLPTIANIAGVKRYLNTQVLDGIDISDVLLKGKTVERDLYWRYDTSKQYAFRSGKWKLLNDALFDLENDIAEKIDVSSLNSLKYNELKEKWLAKDKEVNAK